MADLPTLNEDFLDMLQALCEHDVEFVVVGAHALAAHGLVRATGAIDFFVRPSTENAARLIEALRAFGAPLAQHGIAQADFERAGNVYQVGLPPRRIDLLTQISGVTFEEAWSTRVQAHMGGRTVAIIGRDALVRNKRATGRDKDLSDAKWLDEQGR